MDAVRAVWLGTTPKRYEVQPFFIGIGQAIHCWKALGLGSLNIQFQQDWPKDKKNYSSFKFLPENFKQFHSPEPYIMRL